MPVNYWCMIIAHTFTHIMLVQRTFQLACGSVPGVGDLKEGCASEICCMFLENPKIDSTLSNEITYINVRKEKVFVFCL